MTEESMQIGTSVTSLTAWIAATSRAGSSMPGTPALTSSIWAPASTWAIASALTRSITPAVISAARTFRPVGLIRSPMITNGRSIEMTTSLERERSTVSIREGLHPVLPQRGRERFQWLPARTASRARDADRGDDEDLLLKIQFADHVHESDEDGHIENQLGLDEIGPRSDLFLKPQRAELERRGKRILDGPDEE